MFSIQQIANIWVHFFNLILQEVSRLFRRRDELQVFLRARCHQKNNGFTS